MSSGHGVGGGGGGVVSVCNGLLYDASGGLIILLHAFNGDAA